VIYVIRKCLNESLFKNNYKLIVFFKQRQRILNKPVAVNKTVPSLLLINTERCHEHQLVNLLPLPLHRIWLINLLASLHFLIVGLICLELLDGALPQPATLKQIRKPLFFKLATFPPCGYCSQICRLFYTTERVERHTLRS